MTQCSQREHQATCGFFVSLTKEGGDLILAWIKTLLSGKPHFVIGEPERPYMLRWYLLPRNRWLNVYLHKFLRDDDDRALHDHPWWFVSIMLWGMYTEIIAHDYDGSGRGFVRCAPSIAFRSAEDRHRVVLQRDLEDRQKVIPCWTLVITGRKQREWGFWCPRGFIPWQEFVKPHAVGEIGRGCE